MALSQNFKVAYMGLAARKPVFGVSDKASFKPVYSDYLENGNFACSMYIYDTFQQANNKGADQLAQADLRLVRKPPDRFSHAEAHMSFNTIVKIKLSRKFSNLQ